MIGRVRWRVFAPGASLALPIGIFPRASACYNIPGERGAKHRACSGGGRRKQKPSPPAGDRRGAATGRHIGERHNGERDAGGYGLFKLTRERVVHLVGRSRLDDHAVAEILRSGATEPELVEAVNRVMRGTEVGEEKMRAMTPTVRTLCDILATSAVELGDPD